MTRRGVPYVPDWNNFGHKCYACHAGPYQPCVDTRKGSVYRPIKQPHPGRHATERRPYPREAAVRAARWRLIKQGKIK